MNKIEEILNKYRDITRWPEYPEILENEYIQAMKKYAEFYAQKCLEKLDEEAEYTDQDSRFYDSWVLSDKPSFKFEFPPHD